MKFVIFIEKRKNRTKIEKISYKFEKNLRNDQRKFDYFQKNRKTESDTTETSRPIRSAPILMEQNFGFDNWASLSPVVRSSSLLSQR